MKTFLVIRVTLTWHTRSGGNYPESQPHPSGPADNEEDWEDIEILSPSQPATSTQPEHPLGRNPNTWPEDLDDFGEAEIATLASALKDHLVCVAPKREGELNWATGRAAGRGMGGLVGFGWTICSLSKVLPGAHGQVAWRASTISATASSSADCWRPAQPDRNRWAGLLASVVLNRLKDKKRVALEEDSLQELMAMCSNGTSLKEWSHAGCQGHHSLEPGRSWKTSFARTCSWQWKKGRHGGLWRVSGWRRQWHLR